MLHAEKRKRKRKRKYTKKQQSPTDHYDNQALKDTLNRIWRDMRTNEKIDTTKIRSQKQLNQTLEEKQLKYANFIKATKGFKTKKQIDIQFKEKRTGLIYGGQTEPIRKEIYKTSITNKNIYVKVNKKTISLFSARGKKLKSIKKDDLEYEES